jgi:hypothetical protein
MHLPVPGFLLNRAIMNKTISKIILAITLCALLVSLPYWQLSSVNAAQIANKALDDNITYDDSDLNFVYTGNWQYTKNIRGAYSSTLSTSYSIGDSITLSFEGERLTLLYTKIKNGGVIEVKIDDNLVTTINQSTRSKKLYQQQWSIAGLSSGIHNLTLKHISGKTVNIDACIVRTKINNAAPGWVDDADWSHFEYQGYWQPLIGIKGASLHTLAKSATVGDIAKLQFTGDQIEVIYSSGRGNGYLEISIDSSSPTLIDQGQPRKTTHLRRWISPSLEGSDPHTLTLRHASGGPVNIDTIVIPQIKNAPSGKLYHGVYPGGVSGEEDDLTLEDLESYETIVGKSAAWTYFSNNWYASRAFPLVTATWIRNSGSVPFIRLMLWSSPEQNKKEPRYTLSRIISGRFDRDLRTWCQAARDFSTPIIAEYGTEVNGSWFSWNGRWNGGRNGPQRFKEAYRHIIQICRQEGAYNVIWVFHVNYDDWPETKWNRLENYYPGNEWIDWIAVSVYGAQTPLEDYWDEFSPNMDNVYPRLTALSGDKPIILAEFGVALGNPLGNSVGGQEGWADRALADITGFHWPRLMGFSWWNETWQNDDDPSHDTTMRVQDNPALATVFLNRVGSNPDVLGELQINQ